MITREQFAEEFILNLKNQGFGLREKYIQLFAGIYLDYLYLMCPAYAIMVDPKIIDATRKGSEIK